MGILFDIATRRITFLVGRLCPINGLGALAVLLQACSSSTAGMPIDIANSSGRAAADADVTDALDGAPANDGATTDSGDALPPADALAEDGASECNTVQNSASTVVATSATGSPPAYTQGGTISDGTYWLTAITVYSPSSTPQSFQETVQVSGSLWNRVLTQSGMTRRDTELLGLQGASGTLTYSCDSSGELQSLSAFPSMFTFEVQGSELHMADETDGYLLTYQRQ